MLIHLNRKSFLALYLSILRPCFVLTQANMSSGSVDADKYSVAYVTVPSTDVGKTLGHGLVKNKLAACVNIIPQITSIYEWKNEINEDSEVLLMIKTRTSQVDKLTEYVRSNHPYEVCEVISLPIKNGNPPYLKWIGENVPEAESTSKIFSVKENIVRKPACPRCHNQRHVKSAAALGARGGLWPKPTRC